MSVYTAGLKMIAPQLKSLRHINELEMPLNRYFE